VVAERYRIVGLLGRGGMGEVYRADDMKLARPVALKFLPGSVEQDPSRLNRLLNEVRTALSVSHPNVCRVHDVHQEAGRHFITMEFVDGDDLSALLRRIGRLPSDKALEISRQLCAGLGAAHAAGILHRDLKPANIMIDGRGQVKITDFGLAGIVGGFAESEIRAGTPAYMAPEQLAGDEVTSASDVYALGLVLYEIYTGKRAYEGITAAELAQQRGSAPTSPSSHITDIDPAVERVIMRCLDRDASERPGNALAISAALPGGDPLAAALAAGETPAPQLVAEAGAVGGLKPLTAWLTLAFFGLALIGTIIGVSTERPASIVDLPKSKAVLEDRATEILAKLGYDTPAQDSRSEFIFDVERMAEIGTRPPTERLESIKQLQPSAVQFGYRQSSRLIRYRAQASVYEWIDRNISLIPGDARLRTDPLGRLIWFDAVNDEFDTTDEIMPVEAESWIRLLETAGLDISQLEEIPATWLPPRPFHERRSWSGSYPDSPKTAIRIDAAIANGRPVAFRIEQISNEALDVEGRALSNPIPTQGIPSQISILWIFTLSFVIFIAWRNVKLGRGDRRTALRFAIAFGIVRMAWFILVPHDASPNEIDKFIAHAGWSLYRFALAYAFYLAIEPYARKISPRNLTSWVRLFDGRFRDPLVGRDVLFGICLGLFMTAFGAAMDWISRTSGMRLGPYEVSDLSLQVMGGTGDTLLGILVITTQALFPTFAIVTILMACRGLLRNEYLCALPILIIGISFQGSDRFEPLVILGVVVFTVVVWTALFRIGLLGFFVFYIVQEVTRLLPITTDLSKWWSSSTLIMLGVLIPLALWCFRAALAGRPAFKDRLAGG
jgi:serine/threonine-protein kinase